MDQIWQHVETQESVPNIQVEEQLKPINNALCMKHQNNKGLLHLVEGITYCLHSPNFHHEYIF